LKLTLGNAVKISREGDENGDSKFSRPRKLQENPALGRKMEKKKVIRKSRADSSNPSHTRGPKERNSPIPPEVLIPKASGISSSIGSTQNEKGEKTRTHSCKPSERMKKKSSRLKSSS